MDGPVIVVTARMTIADDKEGEFLAVARDLTLATRAEPGCRSYTLLRDLEEPGCFVFAEEWADPAAFRSHVASEHLASFRQQSAACVTSQSVTMHTVASTRQL
jgi:quinol monooxygenase YgiN